jgi:hypothetical protein
MGKGREEWRGGVEIIRGVCFCFEVCCWSSKRGGDDDSGNSCFS